MVFSPRNFTVLLQSLSLTPRALHPLAAEDRSCGVECDAIYPLPWTNLGVAPDHDCSVQPYDPGDVSVQNFPLFDAAKANVYRYRQQQAVNLGSWFVHENWMVPSLFTCAAGSMLSEIDIASGWGSTESARALLERHWDSFITPVDFHYLSSIGINTVRLPIGYWNLGPDFCVGTPFEPVKDVYRNAWSRVVRAVNMASDVGIGVLVDLHGAPGSQNGQPHSGISDGKTELFGNDWFTNKTLDVLTFLVEELVNVTNVVGIQILNEPTNDPLLPDFYSTAISTMRAVSPAAECLPLYIHDGFDRDKFSEFVANRPDFVVEDTHSYFVFTPQDEAEPASQHTNDVHTSVADSLAAASQRARRNLIVGEFSCALTDDSLKNEPDKDAARRDFCTTQMEIYQNETAGWAFWAYTKEQCMDDPGWCFRAAAGSSLPASFFSYGEASMNHRTDFSAIRVWDDYGASPEPVMVAVSGDGSSYSRSRPFRPNLRRRGDPHGLDQTELAVARGYSDGLATANLFAEHGMSKLGFTGQYMNDSIARLGAHIIAPGAEDHYRRWFLEGLAEGEVLVAAHLAQ
ncbi:glycoside hydrolase [Epithele typhae]|uniref:glycoside hydrolase n=1 Tax=Epithele typhae TaxID=378194 RepID=UPI0020079C69|nr:glycoside hydrolase [Epithele typhae]KAH9945964.1 glycoside hydrolase [Epithele typhae]